MRRAGVGDFRPGLQSAAAAGVKVSRAPYPEGAAGVKLSLEEMARRIREGQNDPGVASKASDVLIQAGFNGRGAQAGTTRQRMAALLAFVRSWMLYAPDPPGTERITSAAAMLCIRPGLCVRTEDCDSLTVLLGSLAGSVGIPVVILKQNYGPQHQEHVLLEAQDEHGLWFPADPSTDMPLGQKAKAVEEVRVDPLDQAAATGTLGAEIVTLGAPRVHHAVPVNGFHSLPMPIAPHRRFHRDRWWHHDGSVWVLLNDVGCEEWGGVMRNPSAALAAEASRRIEASGGDPVSVVFDGRRYLFTQENGAVYIRPCARDVGMGAVFGCDYVEAKTYRSRLIGPYHALREDVASCAGLNADQKAAFAFDFASFDTWYANIPSNRLFCDDAERADIEVGRDLEARLNQWRAILKTVNCQLAEPDLPPLTQDDPRSPTYDLEKRPTTASEIKNVIVTAGIVAAVGAGIYLTLPLLRAVVEKGAEALGGKKHARAR